MIDTPEPPPYTPASYLVSSSTLTTPQLASQFQEFRDSLKYISAAPELVFERLVANLNEAFSTGLELERQQHATALQALQLSNDQLKKELWGLKETIPAAEDQDSTANSQTVSNTCAIVGVKLKRNPRIGTFHTKEIRKPDKQCAETCKVVSFASPHTTPPGLPMGLTVLDMKSPGTVRMKAFATKTQKDSFEVHVDSWGDTRLYQGACTWLEIEADDPDFQYGSYNTAEDPPGRPNAHNERKIVFMRPYSAPPIVVVWLSGFHMSRGGSWRIKTYATDVTKTGFTIHIDSWKDTVLELGLASWVAYPEDRPGVFSGRFNTLDFRPWSSPQIYNSGYENFSSDIFSVPPRTLLAIDSFDFESQHNPRLSVRASSISSAGMTWHIDSWGDTILYSAGVSYIALS